MRRRHRHALRLIDRTGLDGGRSMRLTGKIGIVTAAASGMRRAGALRFAREGAQVAVVDVDAAGVQRVVSEITAAGGTALGITADLTKDEDSRRIVWDTVSRFKGLDFVWNHVGHPGPAAVEGIDMNVFDLAIDLNLRTVLITTEAAIPEMRARGGGSLLFTASTSGLQGSSYSPVYSMCKFGVVGFVKSLAVRLAKEKIRVNAVCPGPIDTPMLRVFVARPDQKSTAGMDPEELVRKRAAGSVPLGRTGQPEEIANAALFLLSAAAVAGGIADCVVVFRALAQGQFQRFGSAPPGATVSGEAALTFPYGLISPAQRFAMRVMRFMHDYGIRQEAQRAIALASYHHAQSNPRAVMHGRPLTPEIYDASRWIVEPFRLYDCCMENDGAAALVLVSAERARDLRRPPAYVLGVAPGSEYRNAARR